MRTVGEAYTDIIKKTRYRHPNYDVIDFEKFLERHAGIKSVFLSEHEHMRIVQLLKDNNINEQTCFKEFGHLQPVSFTLLRYYQYEVGVNGPMHTDMGEPVNILYLDSTYILWNGYHRSLIKIYNGEKEINGFIFELNKFLG